MCLLVQKPRGVRWPKSYHWNATASNPDGVGLAWVEKGKVQVRRFLDPSLPEDDEIYALIASLTDKDVMLHYRWATHGTRDLMNTHPLEIVPGVYLAHNGVMSSISPYSRFTSMSYTKATESEPSDTAILADSLRIMHEAGYDILDPNGPVWGMLDRLNITTNQKLMVVSSKGVVNIHPKLGTWAAEGFWASNMGYRSRYGGYDDYDFARRSQKSTWSQARKDAEAAFAPKDGETPVMDRGTDISPIIPGKSLVQRMRTFYILQEDVPGDERLSAGMILCAQCATSDEKAESLKVRGNEAESLVCDRCEGVVG